MTRRIITGRFKDFIDRITGKEAYTYQKQIASLQLQLNTEKDHASTAEIQLQDALEDANDKICMSDALHEQNQNEYIEELKGWKKNLTSTLFFISEQVSHETGWKDIRDCVEALSNKMGLYVNCDEKMIVNNSLPKQFFYIPENSPSFDDDPSTIQYYQELGFEHEKYSQLAIKDMEADVFGTDSKGNINTNSAEYQLYKENFFKGCAHSILEQMVDSANNEKISEIKDFILHKMSSQIQNAHSEEQSNTYMQTDDKQQDFQEQENDDDWEMSM